MLELIQGRFLEPSRPPEGGPAPQALELKPGQVLSAQVVANQPDGQVLIRLLGRTLLAQSQAPLIPGQALEVVVRQTSPQLLLALLEPAAPGGQAPPETAPGGEPMSGNPRTPLGSPPAPGPAGRELIRGRFLEPPRPPEGGLAPQTPDLKPGQALKALVLGLQPDGQVLIRLLGRTLLAQSQTPLSPGQSLEVVVRQTSPQLMLSLLEPPGPAPGGLAVALQEAARGRQRLLSSLHVLLGPGPPATGDARLADMASRLRQVAQGMLAQEGSGPDAGLLPRQARLSGLDLEARLALLALGRQVELPDSPRTLVPALLARLAPAQEGQKDQALARAWKEFGQAAQELLEHCQDQSRLLGELLPRQNLLLMLPLAWTLGQTPAELLVSLEDQQEREGGEKRPRRLVFFLELAGLGPLAIEVAILGRDLQGRFLAQGAKAAAFLQERLPALAARLEALGFRAFLSAQARPEGQPAREAPLARLIRQQGPHLSLRV